MTALLLLLAAAVVLYLFRRHAQGLWRILFLLAVNALVVAAADRVLGALMGTPRPAGTVFEERVIRLRQLPANLDERREPGASYCRETDVLTNRPVRLRTDGHAFIGPSAVHTNPEARIFFLGGSTTECLWVDESNRFPFAVGRLLEGDTGLRVNSWNAGKGGNNSLHGLDILLNEILPLRPDIAVFMEVVNDLNILLYTGTYWNDHPTRSPVKTIRLELDAPATARTLAGDAFEVIAPHLRAALLRRSEAAATAADEWKHLRGTKLSFNAARIRDAFADNLRTFVSICRIRGVRPVLMTQQNRFAMPPDPFVARTLKKVEDDFGITYAQYFDLYTSMNEIVRSVAKDQDVLLIDLDRLVPKSRDYLYDTVHFNDAGSRFAARLIAAELRKLPPMAGRVAGRPAQPAQDPEQSGKISRD